MSVRYTAEEVNAGIEQRWKAELAALTAKGILPTLATVRVGEKGADISYELGATRRLTALGLGVRNLRLPADVAQEALIAELSALGEDPGVHGILLFQPLPPHLDDSAVKAAIHPGKDVDCTTVGNLGAVLAGRKNGWAYCAPAAVIELLDHYAINLQGKHAVIVGSGLVVGRPLAMLLSSRQATVTLCNASTRDIAALTRQADILISAAGVPGLITANHVRPGQIVIDVGTTYENGKLYGDVDLESVEPVVAAVTPTPGGISGITSTVLAKHVIQAATALSHS